jgi:hypothetical protein
MYCQQCNRVCGVCPSHDIMTVEQVQRIFDESLSLAAPYQRIWLIGGEPTLYPKLSQLMQVVSRYRNEVQGCSIRFWTHGWGKHVARVLDALPPWVQITVSAKEPGKAPPHFNPFLLAPLDYPGVCPDSYENGCSWIAPDRSGIGITRHGIYVCAVAGAIDRVVGRDLGLMSLHDVSEAHFRHQCRVFCGYCGHFLADKGIGPEDVSMSETWRRLVADYEKNPPTLTLY